VSGDPALLFDELLYEIGQAITNHPRSQQTTIGPSEIGMPCARRLGHKLAGTEPPETHGRWLATIGTATHAWLEHALEAANARWVAECGKPRFLLEQRVTVGSIGGRPISGSTDVYDTVTSTVVDWKIVGPTRLKKYRREGPGQQYRVQGHLYGRGWAAAGYPVDAVMVAFLPRNAELRDAFHWSEPYQEDIAVAALNRANRVNGAVQVLGSEAYTLTNGDLTARGLGMLADPNGAPADLALPLDFESCRFCPLLGNGCDGDVAGTEAKKARAFEGLIA
jgi:hypothetical protein